MVSNKKFWSVSAAIVLLVFILGCDDSSDLGTIELLDDEPVILEAVMCLNVDDNGRPVEITDTFLESDSKIYIWIHWANIESGDTVDIAWFEPEEDIALTEDSQTIYSSSGSAITWFSIDDAGENFTEGEWAVYVYLNDMYERSHLFMIVED